MDKIDEAKKICVNELLVPFEGTGPMTPNGDFIAYMDPASKLARMSKTERDRLHPDAYEILGRPWTISWGMTFDETGALVKPGDIWTLEKAVRVKQIVLNNFMLKMFALSPRLALQNKYKIAAVLSWVYNCGLGNYRISTYKKRIDAEDWEGAREEGLKWNKAQGQVLRGLTRRRTAEGEYLLL